MQHIKHTRRGKLGGRMFLAKRNDRPFFLRVNRWIVSCTVFKEWIYLVICAADDDTRDWRCLKKVCKNTIERLLLRQTQKRKKERSDVARDSTAFRRNGSDPSPSAGQPSLLSLFPQASGRREQPPFPFYICIHQRAASHLIRVIYDTTTKPNIPAIFPFFSLPPPTLIIKSYQRPAAVRALPPFPIDRVREPLIRPRGKAG